MNWQPCLMQDEKAWYCGLWQSRGTVSTLALRPKKAAESSVKISMFKFVTIYRQVDDLHKIDTFFSETHLPLAEQLTGLEKTEVSRIHGKPGGHSRFYLMYELYFDSADDYHAALATETGIALMQALKPWGDAKIITWFFAEAWEETTDERAEYE